MIGWITSSASLHWQRVYTKGDLIMVPHYEHSELFVGPGFGTHNQTYWTEEDLAKAGFKPDVHQLLARLGMKEIEA